VSADLAALLARTRYLLLDFDGPICAIFAGYPARQVAGELAACLQADGASVPEPLQSTNDPLDILRFAAEVGSETAVRIEARLCAAEVRAAQSATPTPGAAETIVRWRRARGPVAVVSNNAQRAVETYLERCAIAVDVVVGRRSSDPSDLKPSPFLVSAALEALAAPHSDCVLLGDSPSDIVAARRAAVACIGLVNKPGKRATLSAVRPDALVSDMHELLGVLKHQPHT
jgi:HAD superfamily hydrolase (TIGR01549 family)